LNCPAFAYRDINDIYCPSAQNITTEVQNLLFLKATVLGQDDHIPEPWLLRLATGDERRLWKRDWLLEQKAN